MAKTSVAALGLVLKRSYKSSGEGQKNPLGVPVTGGSWRAKPFRLARLCIFCKKSFSKFNQSRKLPARDMQAKFAGLLHSGALPWAMKTRN
jgi:hypothetical protein